MCVVYSVVGTKGGVSKTTVAMGLSIWISVMRPEKRVLLIDGDLHVRSVELKMCPAVDATLADVLAGKRAWEDAVYTCQLLSGEEFLYPNLAVIPAGGRFLPIPKKGDVVFHFNRAWKIFEKMMSGVRQRFDTVIVDTPASVSYEHLILTAIADRILYVCEANDDSISSTLATAKGLRDLMRLEPAGVVLSRVMKDIDVKPWVKKVSAIAPLLGVIPFDETVDDAFRDNLPVPAAYPESHASLAIKEIAKKLLKSPFPARIQFRRRLDFAIEKVAEKMKSRDRKLKAQPA
jgi:flagellar biosynthesis protein FlhG